MELTSVRLTLCTLIAASFLVQGCAMIDRKSNAADTPEVVVLASAKPARNNSYLAHVTNQIVKPVQS